MPFCLFGGYDVRTWNFSKMGFYLVKYSYHLSTANHALLHAHDFLWKTTWKLDILPKVKNLWWHSLVNILLIMVKLNTRHVYVDYDCPRCRKIEDCFHVFYPCQFSLACWLFGVLNVGQLILVLCSRLVMFSTLNLDKFVDFAVICWKI